MKEFQYTIQDKTGIHARPAGLLVKKAKEFESKCVLTKDGKSAELTKLMALMALGVKYGDIITVTITGSDEDAACAALETFFSENL